MLLLQSTYIYVPVQYRCRVGFTRAHSCCLVCAQNVSLDYLNLSLASYEVNMDAFVAYRSRQLQAPRALIVDLSSTFSLPDTTRGEMATSESPLRDLKMVNHTELLYMYYKMCTSCTVLLSADIPSLTFGGVDLVSLSPHARGQLQTV